eukprot:TRINITY_DN2056_c0_g2_i8.p2 TRINITY_DN2056_c0_g2~~TRINITY_DN2056_c0_g2_i8.p2  ORF type:complete len:231 (-),score=65.51 TRINITY_DN2056_c0_g2_i8:1249-1941(-)
MQVENALEGINQAGSSIGILTDEGITFACERDVSSSLLELSKHSEKIFCLDRHVHCVVSGLAADANLLIEVSRVHSQRFRYSYRENIPIQELVRHVCDIKQRYTQVGGQRPFGAAFLFGGWDKTFKFQLYSSDPSGNFAGWKAIAIGKNHVAANSFLKENYQEGMTMTQGLDLAVKALCKTIDTTNPSPDKLEIMYMTKNEAGELVAKTLNEKEVLELLQRNNFQVKQKE